MRSRALVLAALAVALVPALAGAASLPAAVGRGGEVYALRTGAFGELFPGVQSASPGAPALALDVTRPNGGTMRLLVPGTSDSDFEDSASLVYEGASNAVFVLWQSRALSGRSRLELVSYDARGWSGVIEVSGNPDTVKSSPQVEVTRRSITGPRGRVHSLTVLHLVWSEPQEQDVLYASVVIEDGVYVGWNPVLSLGGRAAPATTAPTVLPDGLLSVVALDPGRDTATAVAAYADASSSRIATAEAAVLPQELGRLADDVRAHIIGAGSTVALSTLANDVRAHIIGSNSGVHPALASFLGDAARNRVLAAVGTPLADDPEGLADEVRAHIIGVGARALFGIATGERVSRRLEILEVPSGAGDGLANHLVAVRVVTTAEVPTLGPAPYRLYVSGEGERVLVSWREAGQLRFRVSSDAGWSDVVAPTVPPGIDVDGLLRARVNAGQ